MVTEQIMKLDKCQLCSSVIDPAKKRYRLTIRVQPDQDEQIPDEDICSADECMCSRDSAIQDECIRELCQQSEEVDFFQEMQLVICEACQVRFSKNPYMQECLLFIGNEAQPKTIH